MAKSRTTTPDRSQRPIPRATSRLKAGRPPAATIPLDDYAKKILLAVLAEIEVLPMWGTALREGATWELARVRDQGVAYQPVAWYGTPLSCAQRKAYSRAAARLEVAGLLWRITEQNRNRVTHLRLTAAGLRRALQMAGRRANRSVIIEGLRQTAWGKYLVAELFGDDGRMIPVRAATATRWPAGLRIDTLLPGFD